MVPYLFGKEVMSLARKIKKELREYVRENYDSLKNLHKRIYKEKSDSDRERNDYQRDYSRILYSTSFRRLQGKMQLLGIENHKFYRNRLTHSLEVSQIARSIAEKVRSDTGLYEIYRDDIYVIEAGSLAHDLGNPPFGHYGERVLNMIMKDKGGFEGNAQTFRILHRLEKKLPDHRGLNLTLRTLLSTIKYFVPYIEDNNIKKFIYKEDYEFLLEELEKYDVYPRTIDVQIVDLADEIAYAAHDLEDALSLKLFNIDEFVFEFKQEYNNDFVVETLEKLVLKAKKFAESAANYNSSEEFSFLFRKELISNLVDKLIKDITLVSVSDDDKKKIGTKHDKELGFNLLGDLVKGLKKKTLELINRSNIIQLYEKQGEKIIKGLYEVYKDESFNKDNMLLPVEYREIAKIDGRDRAIADYISGMMESFAIKLFTDYFGKGALEKIYDKNVFSNQNHVCPVSSTRI